MIFPCKASTIGIERKSGGSTAVCLAIGALGNRLLPAKKGDTLSSGFVAENTPALQKRDPSHRTEFNMPTRSSSCCGPGLTKLRPKLSGKSKGKLCTLRVKGFSVGDMELPGTGKSTTKPHLLGRCKRQHDVDTSESLGLSENHKNRELSTDCRP